MQSNVESIAELLERLKHGVKLVWKEDQLGGYFEDFSVVHEDQEGDAEEVLAKR